jgi:hypothetical protein
LALQIRETSPDVSHLDRPGATLTTSTTPWGSPLEQVPLACTRSANPNDRVPKGK